MCVLKLWYIRGFMVAPGFTQAAPCTSSAAAPSSVSPSIDKPSPPQCFFPVSKVPPRLTGVNICHWQPSIHFLTFLIVLHIFFGKSVPSTLNHVVYGDLALYTVPGEGPDQLKPTGVSSFLDIIIDSMQGYKHIPQAHGAFVFEATKAIFAATRRITLRMEPS